MLEDLFNRFSTQWTGPRTRAQETGSDGHASCGCGEVGVRICRDRLLVRRLGCVVVVFRASL